MKKLIKIFTLFVLLFTLVSCGEMNDIELEIISITFDGNGGTLVSGEEKQEVPVPFKIEYPIYEKEGYEFKGWYKSVSSEWNGLTESNVTIVAQWEIKQYTLTIQYNDGVTPDKVITQNYNSQIRVNTPTRTGYTFEKWSEDIPETMPAENKTISACWKVNQYTLTLKNYYVNSDKVITQDYNSVINVDEPIRPGYTIEKWAETIPSKMPAEDKTIEVDWKVKQYTLTLKNYYGTSDKVITQDYNSAISIDIPTRTGYTFDKWNEAIPSTMPAENKTIEAIWKANQYSLTLKNYYGTTDKVITQDYNSAITVDNPTRTGYSFDKWSEAIPQTMPAENKTIEASWKVNQYTLTVKYNDGVTQDKVITLNYDTTIIVFDPVRIGYTFEKWSETIPSTMPAENKTISACWKANQYILTLKNYYGTTDKVITQDYNTAISFDEPMRTGYSFDRWSETVPLTMPAENKTIEAEWVINQYTLTLKNYYGTSDMTITQDYNSIIQVDKNPTYPGYGLSNWTGTIPQKMPAYDLTITANWYCELKYTVSNDEATVTGYNRTGNVTILDTYEGYPVTKISENAFKNCTTITGIVMSNNITTVPKTAFKGCTGLKTVTLSTSLTYLEESLFYGCTSLESINIPSNIKAIKGSAFSDCTALKNVTISQGLESIGSRAFAKCSALESIVIPEGVTILDEQAFIDCTELKNISIPNSIETIEYLTFKRDEKLVYNESNGGYYLGNASNPAVVLIKTISTEMTEFTISPTCKVIYESAFNNCELLTSIDIPSTVTFIGEYAFAGCKLVSSIVIPNGVKKINSLSFEFMYALTSITVPNTITTIESCAFTYSGLDELIYLGTKAEWNAIEKEIYWNQYFGKITVHCTDGDLEEGYN